MSKNEYPFKEWIWPKSSWVCLVKVRALVQTFTTAARGFPWLHYVTFQRQNLFCLPSKLQSFVHLLKHTHSAQCSRTGRNDSTACSGCWRIVAVLQMFCLRLFTFRYTWKTAQQTQIQWCVSLSTTSISSTTLCTSAKIRNVYEGLWEDPLAANQFLCFQSLGSLNTHMKIMKIYRQRISLTINPPHPPTPSLHSLNISMMEKWDQSSKLKVQSAVNYWWKIPSCQSPFSSLFGSPPWFVTSGKVSRKITNEILIKSQLLYPR